MTDIQVSDYPAMLAEVARVLRPGGLFLSGEWGWGPTFQDDATRAAHPIPAIDEFIDYITAHLLERHSISPAGALVYDWLIESGQFINIEWTQRAIPIDYQDTDNRTFNIGRDFRNAWRWYADSLLPFMRRTGMAEERVEELSRGYMRELEVTPGLVGVYSVVHATRRVPTLVAGR